MSQASTVDAHRLPNSESRVAVNRDAGSGRVGVQFDREMMKDRKSHHQ